MVSSSRSQTDVARYNHVIYAVILWVYEMYDLRQALLDRICYIRMTIYIGHYSDVGDMLTCMRIEKKSVSPGASSSRAVLGSTGKTEDVFVCVVRDWRKWVDKLV